MNSFWDWHEEKDELITKTYLLQLWEILIPVRNNDDEKISKHIHEQWQLMVSEIAGGLIILSPRKGKWKAKTENSIPIRIACTEDQILDIAKKTMEYYGQVSVMVWKVSDSVFMLKTEVIP